MKKLIIITSLLLLPMVSFCAIPAFPMAFWGTITINGSPAPVGTVVRAYYGDILAGQVVVGENGIYGYTESIKQKLTVGEGVGQLSFTIQLSSLNGDLETSGCNAVSYTGFTSGLTVEKNLAFNTTGCGSGGGPFVGQVISTTTPQVVIANPTATANLFINPDVTNPSIDVSSFISGGTGTLPAINITSANANNATVAIPVSTVVTSADATWNGVIAAPTVVTVTIPETSGQIKTFSTAIEVGFTGAKLSFDKAVRILLVGQAGKRAGYVRTGTTFTEITTVCSADTQTVGDVLAPDRECKIDVGSDLVIWTKHFTTFATYTQTTTPAPTPAPATSTGGGGGSGGSYVLPDAITPTTTNKKGDANSDNKVDILDFNTLMINWGKTGAGILADFNRDSKVDIFDFNLLMINWAK